MNAKASKASPSKKRKTKAQTKVKAQPKAPAKKRLHLNTLSPAPGSAKKRVRVGRGIGSGIGKTAGRGHKGQLARGRFEKVGFEGGQMPLQRRLPKSGFVSCKALLTAEITLNDLEKVGKETIDLAVLREANLISKNIERVKVILSGQLSKPIQLKGIRVTAGAKKAIEAAGGGIN